MFVWSLIQQAKVQDNVFSLVVPVESSFERCIKVQSFFFHFAINGQFLDVKCLHFCMKQGDMKKVIWHLKICLVRFNLLERAGFHPPNNLIIFYWKKNTSVQNNFF